MLSNNRQSYWVHLIVNGLSSAELVRYKDKDQATRLAKRAMMLFIEKHHQIENKVKQKIASLKRNVSENSSEWEVLYTNYYNEELSRSHLKIPPKRVY